MSERLVDDVVSLPLELDDITLRERGEVVVRRRGDLELGDGVDKVVDLVVFLELRLGDEVVEIEEDDGDEGRSGRGGEPGDLLLGLFEVSFEMKLEVDGGDDVECIARDSTNVGISPVHQCDLIQSMSERMEG